MSIHPEQFLRDWKAEEFYFMIKFHAWEAHAQHQYSELMRLKNKS